MIVKFVTAEGDTVEMAAKATRPFSLAELNETISDPGRRTFALTFVGDEIKINGSAQRGTANATAKLVTHESVAVFALIEGGWLPPPFVLPRNLLVDRNVVSILAALRGRRRPDLAPTQFWLTPIDSPETFLNPLPYAFEGSKRLVPTHAEFREEFERALGELRSTFTKARLVSFEQSHFDAAYQLVSAIQQRALKESAFLIDVSPLIAHRPPLARAPAVENRIVQLATQHGINRVGFVTIAALSCLYEDKRGDALSIGRLVLKPKPSYGPADAYNALSDLRQLELLVAQKSRSMPPFALCTRDRGVALLWTALNPRYKGLDGAGNFDLDIDLPPQLFPGLDAPGLDALTARLRSA